MDYSYCLYSNLKLFSCMNDMVAVVRVFCMDYECGAGRRKDWVKQITGKRICASSAKHGGENPRIQISRRGCLNFPAPGECAGMTGKCILRMDCAGILKRIFCIYKAGWPLNKMEEGIVNG